MSIISVIPPTYTHEQMLRIAAKAYYHPMGPGTGTMISFDGWCDKGELDKAIRTAIVPTKSHLQRMDEMGGILG